MDILSKTKDITNICLGHECDSYATMYLVEHHEEIKERVEPVISSYDAYANGFEDGIKFLANYLKEYGIDIVIREEVVKTTPKEDWYSGIVVEH